MSILAVSLSEGAYRYGHRAMRTAIMKGECVVLVLGYPTRSDGTLHPVQSFRVRTGVAAYKDNQCSQIVFSGGAARNRYVEAKTMAKAALSLGLPESKITIEGRSRTTWENMGCSSAAYLRHAKQILLVSDSLHVHRAKRYACRQNRTLCAKLIEAGINPPFSLFWWKIPAAAHELQSRLRDFIFYERNRVNNDPPCPG